MKYKDLTNIQAAGEYTKLQPGGYICQITKVEDFSEKEYLKIEYDIADGEFKKYFKELSEKFNFWGGNFIRSYKDSALPFFKAFTTAVEESNRGYNFDYDEHKLVGKYIGLILGEEEYISKDGELKTRLYVSGTRSVDTIRKGTFKVPELKRLELQPQPQQSDNQITDDDLPF